MSRTLFCLGLSLSLLSCKPVANSDSSGVSGTSEVNALNCDLLEPSGGKPSIEMSILPEPYEPEEQSVKLRLGGAPEVLELAYYKSEGKENTEQHVFLKKIYHGGVHEWLEVRYSPFFSSMNFTYNRENVPEGVGFHPNPFSVTGVLCK